MTNPPTFRFSPRANRAHLVQWRAWDTEAFAEAARDGKLIALFITAFWCGVCQQLDETALSSDEVQLLLNAYFVPIRLEESQRPDVDVRYTQEGWPTLAFLTPHAEPILTVNGLDTEPLIALLVQLVDAHEQHRAEFAGPPPPPEPEPRHASDSGHLSRQTVDDVVDLLSGLADDVNGGFGGPHKYFYSDALEFFLHLGDRRGDPRFVQHVVRTLDILLDRAIYDRADGGFFRYSSQPDWNEPHREKLLADQADLLRIYLETFRLTAKPAYRATAERLIDYMDGTLSEGDAPFFAGCQDFVRSTPEGDWTPIVDRWVYCDANALAASSYFHAWRVLGRNDCRDRAERLLDAVWESLRAPTGGLYHYFDRAPHAPGLLIDSVAMGRALLDGYQHTGHGRFVDRAAQLGRDILRMHLNPIGGLLDISEPGPAALQRPITILTQTASAALFFMRLADLSGDARLRDAAHWALLGYGGSARVYGAYAASFGHALDVFLDT